MNSETSNNRRCHPLLLIIELALIALPAGLFTAMLDGVSKEPYGPALYLPVLLLPVAFALRAYVLELRRNTAEPARAHFVAQTMCVFASLFAVVFVILLAVVGVL